MKRMAAIGLVCGAGSLASAWPMWGGLTMAAALETVEAVEVASEDAAPWGMCIHNFSKDGCDGVVEPGHVEVLGGCVSNCRTFRVTDAVYSTPIKTSGLGCGISCESRCDEFADGRLILKFDYVIRADSCCPYRGSWVGKWELHTDDGRVFEGEAHGTIGVGTNRDSECQVTHDSCEKCADVDLVDGEWLIGLEGSYRGYERNSTGLSRDELNFTTDATWRVSSRLANPFARDFKVTSRFDGAHVDYCP